MHNERTNLLPRERRAAIRRDYFLRLSVVIIALLVALIIAAAVLLVPTYVFLTESARTKEMRLTGIESVLSSSDEASLSARLTALSNDAAILEALTSALSASAIIRNMLSISRPGIALSSFSYSPVSVKNSNVLAISGTAATRDSLRNYQLALQGAPWTLSADLPVSAYAKDSDIAFTITVTLAPPGTGLAP